MTGLESPERALNSELPKVRPLTPAQVPALADYWLKSDPDYLRGIGVEVGKLPSRDDFVAMLQRQLSLPDAEKSAFALVLFEGGAPVGHCNLNPVRFGEEAHMHLHIWYPEFRRKGLGSEMVRQAIPVFFERFRLQRLWCEPMAGNEGPNRTLPRLGFRFIKRYRTVPGSINFEQEVNQYLIERGTVMDEQPEPGPA